MRTQGMRACLGLSALLAACGGGGGGDNPPATSLPNTVAITGIAGASAEPGQAVGFGTDLASTAGLSFTWIFGDGSSAGGAAPEHRYARPGQYEVRLTVSNAAGEQRSSATVVTVVRCAGAAAGGWCRQAPGYEQPLLNDLRFATASVGYAAGEFGSVLKTEDGGRNWHAVDLPQPVTVRQIAVADAGRLWLLGTDRRSLWTSGDGGATWAAIGTLPAGRVARIDASRQGWLLATYLPEGATLRGAISSDNGQSWRSVEMPQQLERDGTLWACSSASGSCRMRSRDAGASFERDDGGLSAAEALASGIGFGADGYAWQYTGAGTVRLRRGDALAWETLAVAPLPGAGRALHNLHADGRGTWLWTRSGLGFGDPAYRFHWQSPSAPGSWQEAALPDTTQPGLLALDAVNPGQAAPRSPDSGFADGRTLFVRHGGASDGALSTDGGQGWKPVPAVAAENQRLQAHWALTGAGAAPDLSLQPALTRLERDAAGGLLLTLGRWSELALDLPRPTARHRSTDDGGTWQPAPAGGPPASTVTAIVMLDGQRGLASTDAADTWLQTSNGGRSWTAGPPLPHSGRVSALHLVSSTHGFALQGSRLITTADGGRSWAAAPAATAAQGRLRFVQFLDANGGHASFEVDGNCYLPGSPWQPAPPPEQGVCVRLFRTTNAGASWQPVGDPWAERPEGPPVQFSFVSATQALRGGLDTLQLSTDGGVTWQASSGVPADFRGARVLRQQGSSSLLWAMDARRLLRSSNGGLDWERIDPPAHLRYRYDPEYTGPYSWAGYWALPLRDIQFVDAQNGWLAGDDGLLLAIRLQADGTVSWPQQSADLGLSWRSVAAVPGQGIWVAGERGSILRRSATP